MAEYDGIDGRVRALEIWRGEMGSVKGDIESHDKQIKVIDARLEANAIKWVQMEARVANIEHLAQRHEERITKNEVSQTWLSSFKQRVAGVASTVAVVYIIIQLAWPGAINRLWQGVGLLISGAQP